MSALNHALQGVEQAMYTGKQSDPITGFYFYGARFYYPAISRFISEDQSTGSIASPLSLNRYSYTQDNPESFNDPSGNRIAYMGVDGGGASSYISHPYTPSPAPPPAKAPQYERRVHGEGMQLESSPSTPPDSQPQTPGSQKSVWGFLESFFSTAGHIEELGTLIVGAVLILVPAEIFEAHKLTITALRFIKSGFSTSYDMGALITDAVDRNMIGFASQLRTVAAGFIEYFWNSLDFWDKLEAGGLVLVQAGADVGTGGTAQEVADTIGYIAEAAGTAQFAYEVYSAWSAYQAS